VLTSGPPHCGTIGHSSLQRRIRVGTTRRACSARLIRRPSEKALGRLVRADDDPPLVGNERRVSRSCRKLSRIPGRHPSPRPLSRASAPGIGKTGYRPARRPPAASVSLRSSTSLAPNLILHVGPFARPRKAQRWRPSNSTDRPAPSAGDCGSAERGDQIRKLLLRTKRGSPRVGGGGGTSAE
jgi:hypothetical protein